MVKAKDLNVKMKVLLKSGIIVSLNEISRRGEDYTFVGSDVTKMSGRHKFKVEDVEKIVTSEEELENHKNNVVPTQQFKKVEVTKMSKEQEKDFSVLAKRVIKNKKTLVVKIGEYEVEMATKPTGNILGDLKSGYEETASDDEYIDGDTDFVKDMILECKFFVDYMIVYEKDSKIEKWYEQKVLKPLSKYKVK